MGGRRRVEWTPGAGRGVCARPTSWQPVVAIACSVGRSAVRRVTRLACKYVVGYIWNAQRRPHWIRGGLRLVRRARGMWRGAIALRRWGCTALCDRGVEGGVAGVGAVLLGSGGSCQRAEPAECVQQGWGRCQWVSTGVRGYGGWLRVG